MDLDILFQMSFVQVVLLFKEKAMQGNTTVTLIDGQHLANLVEKYQLHIIPVQIYVLDDYYFNLGE